MARQSMSGADRKSTRLNSSHVKISYAVFCLKKKKNKKKHNETDKNKKNRQRYHTRITYICIIFIPIFLFKKLFSPSFIFFFFFFFFNDTAPTEIYTLSLHDALPIRASTTASRASSSRADSDSTDGTSASR